MTEEYFPRGGKKPNVTYFKQSSNFLGAAEKGQGKKKKQRKRTEDDDGYLSDEVVKEVDQSQKMCAAGIGHKTLKPGLNILGRVARTLETKLVVCLPNKLRGSVMACHISEPYNKVLEAYVNDEREQVRELPAMFRPGQYVALQVLETGSEVMLSAMPQHVNSGRTHSDLQKGDILQAAVLSVEDHGYVMDIGVPNTRAFLPKADADPDIELDTGVLAWTCVKSVTVSPGAGVVALCGAGGALQRALRRRRAGALLPGAAVEFVVDKPLDNGIEGHIFNDTTAYIQRFHADNVKGKKPALGQKIRAHILYVMPTRNAPFLTMKNIFETSVPDLEAEMKFKEGDIIDEAQVLKISGRSIHFKLGRKCVGTMSIKRVAVDEDLSDEQIVAKSYPIGSTHRVRVLTYNMSDYVYHVSDQSSVLEERYFSLEALRPGQLVAGRVLAVADGHVTVTLGRLRGFVPHTHLTDAGVYVDPKKASTSKLTKKKYKEGQEVTARVLTVDPSKLTLHLTLKPTLLHPELAVLAAYEEAEVGKAYTGVVKFIKDFLLVSFFGDVVAYIPRGEVARPPPDNLRDAFHLGQIVNCTILSVDLEKKKMLGTLTTPPFWPAKRRDELNKRKNEVDDDEVPKKKLKSDDNTAVTEVRNKKKDKKSKVKNDEDADEGSRDERTTSLEALRPGQLVACRVLAVADAHVTVTLGRLRGFVPHTHLTDAGLNVDPKKATTNKKKYKEGQEVMARVLSVDPSKLALHLTLKPTLLDPELVVLAAYEEAEIGKAYTGVVKFIKDFLLVSFFGDVVAYVPRGEVARPPPDNLRDAFHLGQIVDCTILSVDVEKKRMLGTLITPPFWPAKRRDELYKSRKEPDVNEVSKKKLKSNDKNADTEVKNKKKDKKSQIKVVDDTDEGKIRLNEVSEESDAIETDIHEDSDQALTPEDKALIDLSDCKRRKEWKKRIAALQTSIKNRQKRIERINKKILTLEETGLTAQNKKYHTAMHQDKLSVEERVKKLEDALKTALNELSKLDPEYVQKIKKAEKRKLKAESKKALKIDNDENIDKEKIKEIIQKKKEKKLKKAATMDEKPEEETEKSSKKDIENKRKVKKGEEVKEIVDKSKEIKVVESLEPALEVPSAKEFWSENADNLAKSAKEDTSSSSEDEEAEAPKKKRKKLSAAEKVAKARAEEERLRELERRAATSDAQPRSSDQFERALLASPNCSQLWIAYMAFHLQATEIDKARAVARKALNTISFREEQEKLNVWLALLNLENRFGTKESQQKTLEDALQMNDTFNIHSKLLDIYADTAKSQELSALVDLMLRKYKRDPRNYTLCGAACFKLGLVDKARHVMQKAVGVLEKKEHVSVLVQFALMERAQGSRERAEALFEQVLAVYPQRVDVCAAYADMLAKSGDVQAVRQVMERMTSQKLPARKIKVLFNKWAEIEERAGDSAQAELVRQRAVDYIEKAKF